MTQTRSIHTHPGNHQAQQIENASRMVRKVLIDALVQAGLGGDADEPALRVARAAQATAPAQMAAAQADDAATRQQLAASYERCLDSYRGMAQPHADEPNVDDVGRAVAFFVAINLHALHGVDAGTDMLKALERQLRGIARARSNWDRASIAERQCFFERIAILSVVVSGSHAGAAAQGPSAVANVRRAAHQYLEQMLGMNPDLLTLGPEGLTARHESTSAATGQAA